MKTQTKRQLDSCDYDDPFYLLACMGADLLAFDRRYGENKEISSKILSIRKSIHELEKLVI